MPITEVITDTERLTLTIVADFTVPVRRLWDAYLDPRQIEKFWGPPEYPARFFRHDGTVDGVSEYVMTGPDGDRAAGYWRWTSLDAPHHFEVVDGFAGADGAPNTDLPTIRMRFEFLETALGSRLVTTSFFGSLDELEQLVAMGMEEGTRAAMTQIDAVVADLSAFAAGRATDAEILDDTRVRISRVIRGPLEHVWRAHHEPDLVKRWMLGPDGWTMPVCQVATKVGEHFRYEWEPTGGDEHGQRFGFVGELLETDPPFTEVSTEAMIGMEEASTLNRLTLTPHADGTLLTLVITYPNQELRDIVLETGMVDGMEYGYARLEQEVIPAFA